MPCIPEHLGDKHINKAYFALNCPSATPLAIPPIMNSGDEDVQCIGILFGSYKSTSVREPVSVTIGVRDLSDRVLD